jgi:hypothetical protein
MQTATAIDPEASPGRPSFAWDVNTALAALVFGAFMFLVLVAKGFKGFNISVN